MENLIVVLTDGSVERFKENEYTDYEYDGKCLVIKRRDKIVALFNVNILASAFTDEIHKKEKENEIIY